MFVILSLFIIVAAFNIFSGLTILVKNKTRDIGILKSIGVQNSSIKNFFLSRINYWNHSDFFWDNYWDIVFYLYREYKKFYKFNI